MNSDRNPLAIIAGVRSDKGASKVAPDENGHATGVNIVIAATALMEKLPEFVGQLSGSQRREQCFLEQDDGGLNGGCKLKKVIATAEPESMLC